MSKHSDGIKKAAERISKACFRTDNLYPSLLWIEDQIAAAIDSADSEPAEHAPPLIEDHEFVPNHYFQENKLYKDPVCIVVTDYPQRCGRPASAHRSKGR